MQLFELHIHALEADGDCGLVTLRGSFHPIYTSQLFLRVPLEELSKFSIGQIYIMTAQPGVELVETVPLDAVRSRFDDGSPVPSECDDITQQDREQRGYHPPAPLGIPGDSLASSASAEGERRGGYRL